MEDSRGVPAPRLGRYLRHRDRRALRAASQPSSGAGAPERSSPALPAWLRRRRAAIALGVLGLVLIGLLWELALQVGLLPAGDIPHPVDVLRAFWELLGAGEFWAALGHTFAGAGVGLAIAVAIALVGGVLMGASTAVRRAFRPIVEFLRPVPGITLIPLAIIIWGPTTASTIFLVAFGCTWPMLIQTMAGVSSVDEVALMTARSYGLGPLERVRWVIVPGALPYIATGLRICASIALIVSVGAELIIGTPGIGSMIRQSQQFLLLDQMYALVLAAGLLGIFVNMLFGGLERRFLRWHPSHQGAR